MGQFFQKKGYILVASIDRKKPSNLHPTQFFPHYVKNFTLLFFPCVFVMQDVWPQTSCFCGAHCRPWIDWLRKRSPWLCMNSFPSIMYQLAVDKKDHHLSLQQVLHSWLNSQATVTVHSLPVKWMQKVCRKKTHFLLYRYPMHWHSHCFSLPLFCIPVCYCKYRNFRNGNCCKRSSGMLVPQSLCDPSGGALDIELV